MKQITLKPINEEVWTILKNMEKLKLVKVINDENTKTEKSSNSQPIFAAIQLDTSNFKFCREQANER